MTTLTMTKGLPASGKSTWACAQVAAARPGSVVRINKDLLRRMLHNSLHKARTERQVLEARDLLLAAYLSTGVDVIVDDTNLNPFHEARLREIAQQHGADFAVQDFTGVDLDTCLSRDRSRDDSVGEKVILGMYEQYLKPAPVPPPQLPHDAPEVLLVDVDGTVALMGDRSPYAWDRVGEDRPNRPVIDLVRLLHAAGYPVVFLSGRDGSARAATEAWLAEHLGLPFELFMRAPGDNRKDALVKRELFDAHIAPRYRVHLVLDDRDQVVRMWRDELGLTCLQVANGAF